MLRTPKHVHLEPATRTACFPGCPIEVMLTGPWLWSSDNKIRGVVFFGGLHQIWVRVKTKWKQGLNPAVQFLVKF